MTVEIEQTIITNVLKNPDYFGIVAPHLKQEYFQESKYKKTLDMIFNFHDEYGSVPSYEALRITSDKLTVDENTYNEVNDIITTAESSKAEENLTWLTNETEHFCKEQALYNALSDSLTIKQNSELPLGEQDTRIPGVGAIPDMMKDALSIAFDSSVGHDYFGDAESRHESYNKQSKKYSFGPGLESLDKLTGGGVEAGTLQLIMAPVNCFVGEEEIEVYVSDETYKKILKSVQI